jgi:Ankyrin repeats (3 copies)
MVYTIGVSKNQEKIVFPTTMPHWVSKIAKDITEKVEGAIEIMKERKTKFLQTEEIVVACQWFGLIYMTEFGALIRETGDISIIKDIQGIEYTILMYAANFEYIPIVKLLLAHPDVSVNPWNSDGYTALMLTASYDLPESTKLLLADSRIDLRAHDQWIKALKLAKTPEIRSLLEAKMREQGIDF